MTDTDAWRIEVEHTIKVGLACLSRMSELALMDPHTYRIHSVMLT